MNDCNLCKESLLDLGERGEYGAVIIGKVDNGWFATLSPKTGGKAEDFSIQIMPCAHLTHFSQMNKESAKSYGIIFSKVSKAMTELIGTDETSSTREKANSIATYGKCTNWKEKKEHLHIKIFPFRGDIGQPYTVDSSFGRKKIYKDNDEEYVRMKPVKKKMIEKKRFEDLAAKLISLLK